MLPPSTFELSIKFKIYAFRGRIGDLERVWEGSVFWPGHVTIRKRELLF